jgi:hypothetical protein
MSEEITVPLGLLRRYLAFHVWKPQQRVAAAGTILEEHSFAAAFFRERSTGRRNADIYVLAESGLDDIEIVVPRTLDTHQALRRLEGIINTLSQVEGKDRHEIVSEIRSIGFDVVRSRVPELVFEDTIDLDQAVNYTANIKKLLAAGAITEITPDLYFFRVKKEGL